MPKIMLSIRNLCVDYDGIVALDTVSIDAPDAAVTALIGANGAGKTTLLKTISGLLHPSSGEITFESLSLLGEKPERIVGRGISHVPEGRGLFPVLSVRDNLMTGAHLRRDKGGIKTDLDKVYSYFPVLKDRRHQLAKNLSGGQQQMLAIGRGIMANPKFFLFDEPSVGLAPLIVEEVLNTIKDISVNEKRGVVLVEQNANLALRIADRTYVLEMGKVVLEGTGQSVAEDPRIRKAYLGL
jgi:branched-chain amino acid transport system ATP-binding protein